MINRSSLFLSLSFCLASSMFAGYAADTDSQDVSFDKPVQIPEAVLQPGKYSIRLEDRMADRAIVRITEPSGTEHYLLTVPSKSLKAAGKGLIFFPDSNGAEALNGWECSGCKRPLEFVYPKDEAVKLTASTGKPILAYDPSYDKLPANLSPADRKVVTLWLLAPKTVTPQGTGEGLTAAKYSAPRAMASAEPLPKTMPKTASLAFLELLAGIVSFIAGTVAFLWRKVSAMPTSWKMLTLTTIGGIVTGFALPIASSYDARNSAELYVPSAQSLKNSPKVFEVPAIVIASAGATVANVNHDSEVERLKARNRRLEALLATLRQRPTE